MVQEMIGGEHALRALTPYGELLVFTSTELPCATGDTNGNATYGAFSERHKLYKVVFVVHSHFTVCHCNDNKFPIRNSDLFPPGTDLVEHSHDIQPVDDPICRGCFNVLNEKYELDRVVAHLSDKECQSVSEKAKLLLLYLHFEMVSKADLWPEYFNTLEANAYDIELFFFSSEARHREIFDHLVEDMIGGVYDLRALMPYGELLVFTST
uniref:E4/E8 binding protein-1 n=1 Tax=Solanum tuberosum TaxID=4113 RepID=M1CXJ1_SOLTU